MINNFYNLIKYIKCFILKIETIPTAPADKKELQKFAINCFSKAIAFFENSNFNYASKLMHLYTKNIDYKKFFCFDNREIANKTIISIVIVAYKTGKLLLECIDSLNSQVNKDFEIIIIDNGGNENIFEELKQRKVLYIQTPMNLIPSEGRNIASCFSKGKILAFLDDDAIASKTFTESIINTFTIYDIIALRGCILPKKNRTENTIVSHYNLGESVFPFDINTEGNSAFLKSVYDDFNGMDPLLFGHEGEEISIRIVKKYKKDVLIYSPDTIIYHDYSISNKNKQDKKNKRHKLMKSYLKWKHFGYKKILKNIRKYINRPEEFDVQRLIKKKLI